MLNYLCIIFICWVLYTLFRPEEYLLLVVIHVEITKWKCLGFSLKGTEGISKSFGTIS